MPTPSSPMPVDNTLLYITPLSGRNALLLTPYAARGLTQTLEPIGGDTKGALTRRSVNGRMIDLTYPWFRQYQSTISCRDTNTPCLDDAWIGQIVQVDCACELNYITGESPQRPVVFGSSRVEGHVTFYRPSLIMMVTAIRNSFAEYEGMYQWQIDLQEDGLP